MSGTYLFDLGHAVVRRHRSVKKGVRFLCAVSVLRLGHVRCAAYTGYSRRNTGVNTRIWEIALRSEDRVRVSAFLTR